MILTQIREKIKSCLKTNDPQLGIYRSILARVQADTVKQTIETVTDEQVIGSMRKMFNENKNAIAKAKEEAAKLNLEVPQGFFEKLEQENSLLNSFIPSCMDGDTVVEMLLSDKTTIAAIVQAANDNVAVGVAMKFLKTKNVPLDGNIVKEKVKEIRDSDAK